MSVSPRRSPLPAPQLSNPALVTADDEVALSHKIRFLYLDEEGLWCFLFKGGGRRALLSLGSSASRSFAVIVSEVIAATAFPPDAAGCPLLSEWAISLARTIDLGHLLTASSQT